LPSKPDGNQTSKDSHLFEGTPIKNLQVETQMHTKRAKKTDKVCCKPLKCTLFGVLGEYDKHMFGVLGEYTK